ncbi:MAG: domain S-box-containing protein [Rhodospirillales bacterium]|nr:domain S-box-containing protein [Rhodospirillales bacterium]
MASYISWLFSQQKYMPHGMCFLWQPELIWLHSISDTTIAAAYFSVPIALIYFVSRRRDLAFPWVFRLAGLFILACGTTHVMGVWTLWHPNYRVDGMIKLFTAMISITAAAAIWRIMPLALALPSGAQLAGANQALKTEIGVRQRAEAALHQVNAELERRVAERTAELQAEIDQRRRTELTLRASEERWRGMFEASAVGIVLIDQKHRIAAANKAFQNMIGYTIEELQSLTMRDITHEDDRAMTEKILDNVMTLRGRGDQVEKRYRHKDGQIVWGRVSAARAPYEMCEFFGVTAVIEDITERKRVEDALNEAREALMRMTRFTIMGELSASIAHEINQPLAAIIINGNVCTRLMAAAKPDLAELRAALDDIVSDGKRASTVVNRIRALLKNVATERSAVDINEAIDELLTLTRNEFQRHRVSVRAEFTANLPLIIADRVQIQQVVLNLVMNAIEAMNTVEDRPRILTIRSAPEGNDQIRVSVTDVGIGLSPIDRKRIFESFFTTKPDGMGIGLSISRSIVEAHQGQLWAEAGLLHGATFSFRLPVVAG